MLDGSSLSPKQGLESSADSRLAQRVLSTSNEVEIGSMLGTDITPIDWSIDTQEMPLQDRWTDLDDVCLPSLFLCFSMRLTLNLCCQLYSQDTSYHVFEEIESNQEFGGTKASQSTTVS